MKKIYSPVVIGGPGLSIADIRHLAKSSPDVFVRKVVELAESGKIRLRDLHDLRTLYQGLADIPVRVTMPDVTGAHRSITASAFPILVGSTVVAAVNEAYGMVPTIGQELVEDFEDNKKVSTVVGIHALDNQVSEVKENEDFPEIGASEESVQIRHRKNGRKVTISAEAILENDIVNIVRKVNAVGKFAADWQEEQTLSRVTDHDGSKASASETYVYRPNNSGGTALFSATANTPGTRAPSGTRINSNAFVDETDLDNVRTRLASMLDANGKRIAIPRSMIKILCPDAILGNVLKVANSEYVPGVENELSNWGPRGSFHIPPERILSSPRMDDLSTSAWYYGAPQLQFLRKWKMRMEYVTLGTDTQAYLNSQVAFQARVAWDMEIGATDYVFWLQNLSATTAPADE